MFVLSWEVKVLAILKGGWVGGGGANTFLPFTSLKRGAKGFTLSRGGGGGAQKFQTRSFPIL